jgi:hypothetical protein
MERAHRRALDEGAHFLNSDLVLHWAEATLGL